MSALSLAQSEIWLFALKMTTLLIWGMPLFKRIEFFFCAVTLQELV